MAYEPCALTRVLPGKRRVTRLCLLCRVDILRHGDIIIQQVTLFASFNKPEVISDVRPIRMYRCIQHYKLCQLLEIS